MTIRKVIEAHPIPVAAVAVVLIVTASFWLTRSDLGGGADWDQSQRSIWFYDLDTGSLFPSDGPAIAPIIAPSGGRGVYAHVYSCGKCDEAIGRRIIYLSTHPDDNPAGRLVAPFDESNPPNKSNPPKWVDAQNDDGIATTGLSSKLAETCPDRIALCYP